MQLGNVNLTGEGDLQVVLPVLLRSAISLKITDTKTEPAFSVGFRVRSYLQEIMKVMENTDNKLSDDILTKYKQIFLVESQELY